MDGWMGGWKLTSQHDALGWQGPKMDPWSCWIEDDTGSTDEPQAWHGAVLSWMQAADPPLEVGLRPKGMTHPTQENRCLRTKGSKYFNIMTMFRAKGLYPAKHSTFDPNLCQFAHAENQKPQKQFW